MLDVGMMRDRFMIQRVVKVQNTYNENRPTYEDVREVYGYLRTLAGRQLQLAQASTITSTATHLLSVWYTPDIAIGNTRLKLATAAGSRTFAINHVNDVDNRHVEMILTVTEVVA